MRLVIPDFIFIDVYPFNTKTFWVSATEKIFTERLLFHLLKIILLTYISIKIQTQNCAISAPVVLQNIGIENQQKSKTKSATRVKSIRNVNLQNVR